MSTLQVAEELEEPEPTELEDERKRGRRYTGYVLIIPGLLWLALFFLIPFYSLVATSLYDPAGTVFSGYEMTWEWSNYTTAITENWQPLVRSFVFGGLATIFCLLLGYPLAYAIAFKAGRWKNLMLVLVIAPFFTSFLIRTISWQLILADNGFVVDTL
ncbi:MAG TPA: ABC transporter permease, partial [Nocardioidaceae bacterium]|nr:ABC transporter permease [Nocardioidaceae bacterium]